MSTGTYARNITPIINALTPLVAELSGNALEIGSGTGQHIKDFARDLPALHWTPSDLFVEHLRSIDAWRNFANAPSADARNIDAAGDWAGGVADLAPLKFILSLNVIHIAPVVVAKGIVAGAGKTLGSGGLLAFYGPFKEDGAHTGDGNATFDQRLRADNPDWGIRDTAEITALATAAGLTFQHLIKMPANNQLLIFRKP